MTNGLTAKVRGESVTYDIHLNNTACSGYSNTSYTASSSRAILSLFRAHYSEPGGDHGIQWDEDIFNRYKDGHTVIAPMVFVRWGDE